MQNSNQNLLDLLDEQKKTIEKYSNKLRDVVAAHKSLLVEKKALEDAIKILNKSNCSSNQGKLESHETEDKENTADASTVKNASEIDLKNQLASLLSSVANLSAEKSHMEECYKANQKQLLDEKEKAELKNKELQDQVKLLVKELKSLQSKSQIDLGCTKRDKKKNRETSKCLKQQSDDSLGENKSTPENESLKFQLNNYEDEIKRLMTELGAEKQIREVSEKKLLQYSNEIFKLKEEIRNLQMEHQISLQNEKEKAKDVEEHAKKLTAMQEERVVNLETRLAELSEIIGSYDRLRLHDQAEIQKLKDHIAFIGIGAKEQVVQQENTDSFNSNDYDSIVKKILMLKDNLEIVAKKSGRDQEFNNLFSQNVNNSPNIHLACKEEYNKLKAEFEGFKNEVKLFNNQAKSAKDVILLQNQIKNLQEKVRILTEKNKEIEKEYQLQIEQLKKNIRNEKARFKEILAASETDYRGKYWLLEEQLQKQRERSLALLEEKEQEIHALQTTFQMFLPECRKKLEEETGNDLNAVSKNQFLDGPHIVHYANELARKDIEISSLRRNKHQIEMALRDLQKELASNSEKYSKEKELLNEEISRLERCQTREGANLEYLKNVVYSFLLSSDPKSKRHMCNAIAAVLKFSESEFQKVINHSKNSWWSRSNYL